MIDDMETMIELFKYYVSIIGEIPGSVYFLCCCRGFYFCSATTDTLGWIELIATIPATVPYLPYPSYLTLAK